MSYDVNDVMMLWGDRLMCVCETKVLGRLPYMYYR